MSKLREKYIQAKAIEELEALYRKDKNLSQIYSCCEVQTIKEKGRKRADGLLCFNDGEVQYYTVSFEAKSHRTLHNLLSYVNYKKQDKLTISFASALSILLVILSLIFFDFHWSLIILVAAGSFILSGLLFEMIVEGLNLDRHKISDVIEQLKQYPANEQWVVYSKDTYNLLAKLQLHRGSNQQQILQNLCSTNGFGLMLISRQKREVIIWPLVNNGNFLGLYCKEEEIKKYLESNGTMAYKNPCRIVQEQH